MSEATISDSSAIGVLAQNMVGQESAGPLTALLLRLARFLTGDPAGYINVVQASSTVPLGLPDLPGVQSAILYVAGNGVNVRLDGGAPVGSADFYVAPGSYIILTGVPSIKGFQFVAQNPTATLFGCYFT